MSTTGVCRALAPIIAAILMMTSPAMAIGPLASDAPYNGIWNCCRSIDPDTGGERIDAACFFDLLVNRYQRLRDYEDTADVDQTTRRIGNAPRRVQTRIGCEIVDGKLVVNTPTSSAWPLRRLTRGLKRTPAMEDAAMQYRLWLAPHMALKYAEDPDKDFRTGIDEGFTATEAEAVTIDSRPMVHLELKSGDGLSGDSRATFDLFVNPESMLVEQIRGQQRLPDGASYETTLTITPTTVRDVDATEPGDDLGPPPCLFDDVIEDDGAMADPPVTPLPPATFGEDELDPGPIPSPNPIMPGARSAP